LQNLYLVATRLLREKIGDGWMQAAATRSAPRASPPYFEAESTLENAQAMAACESLRATELYDRTGDEVTLNEMERIAI
jgi:hypothetical protein